MPDEEAFMSSDPDADERHALRWQAQRELRAAREEAASWKAEALSLRRHMGIPVEPVITRRKARKALDANKAPEPGSGSDDRTKE